MKGGTKRAATTQNGLGASASTSWLTRRQVAAVLHVSEQQVSAMEGHQLFPKSAADRSRRYSPDEVAGILAGASADGVVTAQAFELFKRNVSMPDVVIETRQPAARIRALRGEYDAMVGSMVLPANVVEALRAHLGSDSLTDTETLAAAIGRALDARYKAGFREGQADVQDFGEIIDQQTGERRRVTARGREP